jgi:ABC-type uncharacterized transport system substrate-binding protein
MPVIGFLNTASLETYPNLLRAFHRGLKETGYVEGENVTIEYRWAENQFDRLPTLARELVKRHVAVFVTTGGAFSALAAKEATTTIPVVFAVGEDPVRLGLVASLARPGGNVTGVKRELVPGADRVASLVNPANTAYTEATLRDTEEAARSIGLQMQIANASTAREIDAAFTTFVHDRIDALFVFPDSFFISRRVQLVQLAARYAIPAAYPARDFAEVGGLMSYGTDTAEAWRQTGTYAGRILKGAKPVDLPVVQSSKFEIVPAASL